MSLTPDQRLLNDGFRIVSQPVFEEVNLDSRYKLTRTQQRHRGVHVWEDLEHGIQIACTFDRYGVPEMYFLKDIDIKTQRSLL